MTNLNDIRALVDYSENENGLVIKLTKMDEVHSQHYNNAFALNGKAKKYEPITLQTPADNVYTNLKEANAAIKASEDTIPLYFKNGDTYVLV